MFFSIFEHFECKCIIYLHLINNYAGGGKVKHMNTARMSLWHRKNVMWLRRYDNHGSKFKILNWTDCWGFIICWILVPKHSTYTLVTLMTWQFTGFFLKVIWTRMSVWSVIKSTGAMLLLGHQVTLKVMRGGREWRLGPLQDMRHSMQSSMNFDV